MKEYEAKSLEELRVEDYLANRKGPQAGGATSLFGSSSQGTSQASTGFGFGQQQNKPTGFGGFGTSTSTTGTTGGGLFGQQQSTSGTGLFGASKSLFGTTTTASTTTGFGSFGQPSSAAGGSLFGANNQQKVSDYWLLGHDCMLPV